MGGSSNVGWCVVPVRGEPGYPCGWRLVRQVPVRAGSVRGFRPRCGVRAPHRGLLLWSVGGGSPFFGQHFGELGRDVSGVVELAPARQIGKVAVGDLLQVPPMASALKQGGVRLYDLHRRGISVEREARPVKVHSLALAGLDPTKETATFEISCSSGTYIRTLINDLANSLGSGAYLTALRRTSVGHLSVSDAHAFQDLLPETLHNHIIPPNDVIANLPEVAVSEETGRGLVCHGGPIERGRVDGSYRVMCGGELLAVYRDDEDAGRAEVVLCAP